MFGKTAKLGSNVWNFSGSDDGPGGNQERFGKMREEKRIKWQMFLMGLFLTGMAVFGGGMLLRGFRLGIGVLGLGLTGLGAFALFVSKGRKGELVVGVRLLAGLPDDEYILLSDLYLPLKDGGTTQVDHVVVSRFGVFVIEAKMYTGWVFGDKQASHWTHVVYKTKHRFQNPMRQNWLHVCAISENLGLPKKYLRSVVVFTGDVEFKTPMPEGVVYSKQAAEYILSFTTPLYSAEERDAIVSVLKEWSASVSKEQRRAHVANLRKRLEKRAEEGRGWMSERGDRNQEPLRGTSGLETRPPVARCAVNRGQMTNTPYGGDADQTFQNRVPMFGTFRGATTGRGRNGEDSHGHDSHGGADGEV